MNNRLHLKNFFELHVKENKRYCFTVKNTIHLMDSQFIINEILDSSLEELEDIKKIIEDRKIDEESIHQFLSHLAILYSVGNQKKSS